MAGGRETLARNCRFASKVEMIVIISEAITARHAKRFIFSEEACIMS